MRKTILTLFIAFGFLTSDVNAQATGSDYQTAIGIKFYPGALTFKHFMRDDRAVEVLAYFYNYGYRVTGLYEIHGDINGLDGLKWYLGPGAHIGVWNDQWASRFTDRQSGIAIGVDGVIGLDYKIPGVPINLSVDWQPSFNIIRYASFEPGWGGLGIRYTLK